MTATFARAEGVMGTDWVQRVKKMSEMLDTLGMQVMLALPLQCCLEHDQTDYASASWRGTIQWDNPALCLWQYGS